MEKIATPETGSATKLNLTSGTNLTQFLNSKTPGHLHLYDVVNAGVPSPLNIIYFGNEVIPKEFIHVSEQYIRPAKYNFLGKTILSSLTTNSLLNKEIKSDPLIMGRSQPILKKAQNKPIVFDISGLYPTFTQSFNNYPKNRVKDGLELLLNSITNDFSIKAPNRKNILLLSEENIKIGTGSGIDSIISFLRYMVIFKLPLNVTHLDAVVFFNSKNNLFYPLTLLSHVSKDSKISTLVFNNHILIRLIKDIQPNAKNIDEHLNPESIEDAKFRTDLNITSDKKEINDLLNKMDKLENVINSSDSEAVKSTTQEKEKIVQQIKDISSKYPGAEISDRLKYIFNTDSDNKVIAETTPKTILKKGEVPTTSEHQQVVDTIERINQVYNGAVLFKDIEPNLVKQVFQPGNIVGLEEISSINKQKTEMFEKMDENIRDLTEAFSQDPDIKIKVLDIKSKLVETNKDRFIEYSVKIQHDYGIATKKPYNIIFRVPAPIDDKYIKIGGNNYIMIQQLFPKPIQKVSNTVARLYTHYNTTSVILKGSILETKDFKVIEKEFIDGLVQSKLLQKSNIHELSTKDKEKLLEYGCPLSAVDLQYNFAF
jgi:hypothetical protein